MFNKNRSITLAALILLIGSSVCLLRPIKNQSTAKAASVSKYAVSEIPCYPISQYKSPVSLKKFAYQDETFFEVDAPQRISPDTTRLNFEVSPKICRQIGDSGIASREDFMPKEAAEYFANQFIEGIFQTCLRKESKASNAKQKCNDYLEKLFNVPGTLNEEHNNVLLLEEAEELNRRGIKTDKALIIKPKTGFHLLGPEEEIPPTGAALITLLKKCIKVTPPEKVKNVSVVRTQVVNVPTLGKKSYFHVDVELVNGKSFRHESQIILANKEYCKRFQ